MDRNPVIINGNVCGGDGRTQTEVIEAVTAR